MLRILCTFMFSISLGSLRAQSTFDAASIKPSPPETRFFSMKNLPGARIRTTGATLADLLQSAYHLNSFQVIGGPSWLRSARYDISATANGDSATPEQKRRMIQSLLADRFGLVVHREARQLPIYELAVTKSGSKLKGTATGSCPDAPQQATPCGGFRISNRSLMAGNRVTVVQFAAELSYMLDRLVVDKTGINGIFDIYLTWTPDPNLGKALGEGEPRPTSDGPSIFTAMQEQLGLRLEPRRGPVDVLLVDRAEKPSPN